MLRPTKVIKDLCKAITNINAIYVLALQRSLIILVGLTMTCFSEKMISSPTRTKNIEWYPTLDTQEMLSDRCLKMIWLFICYCIFYDLYSYIELAFQRPGISY